MNIRKDLSRITIDIPKVDHRKLKTLNAKIPNKKTLKVIADIEAGKGLVKSKNIDDLFKKLGI